MAPPLSTKTRLTHTPTQWHYRGGQANVELPPELIQAAGGSELLARLLWNRETRTAEQAQAFLRPPLDQELADPFDLPDMDLAVERIGQALRNDEVILIYGDFDVDGITGTAILMETLTHLGAKVSYYIPDRATEGHGLNATAVLRLASTRQCKLVITTDTGISNFNEISLLKGLGVDTIVTDHHELPEHLPPSVANVNSQRLEDPNHPMAVLCGAGVAYLLCQLLLAEHRPGDAEELTKALLDLVAVGIVADMVPLQRDNRVLVQRGLAVLHKRERLGLRCILEGANVAPETVPISETIGFTIGPRLNALGRLSNATEGVELLITKDEARARHLAATLEQLNRKRQDLCDKTFLEAEGYLQATGGIDGRKAIILASPDWNPGIIGIVASRLIEKYRLPTFLMVVEEGNNKARCSARSVPGFHLTENLETLSSYFLNFGGHAGAAGFSIPLDKLEAFKKDLWQLALEQVSDEDTQPILEVDCRLTFDQLTPGLLELIAPLAPFGMKNPAPLFVLENVKLATQRPLGDNGQHLKLMVQSGENRNSSGQKSAKGYGQGVEAFLWRCGPDTRFDLDLPYHMVVSVEKNTYDRGTPIRLVIKDMKAVSVASGGNGSARIDTAPLLKPVSATAKPARPIPSDMAWVDHRQRPNVDTYLAELLSESPGSGTDEGVASLLVYNEGRAPAIALLNPQQVANRLTVGPAKALVFWDLPPSAAVLAQVLAQVKPTTVHWVGAKYQTVPLQVPPPDFLKAIYTALHNWMNRDGQATASASALPVDLLASRFASVPTVILQGVSILGQMGFVKATLIEGEPTSLQLSPGSVVPQPQDWNRIPALEVHLFEQASHTVTRYRQHLLTASLDDIRDGLSKGLA
jgi:single-stranded-DNA-specific exonuclease RecJ